MIYAKRRKEGFYMVGKKIAEIRKDRGYSLSELAEKANISKSYLSNIERQLNHNPSIQVLIKIAQVLQVEIDELLEGDIKQETKTLLEKEWIDFIDELKASGLEKGQLGQYKMLIDFIRWQNEQETEDGIPPKK